MSDKRKYFQMAGTLFALLAVVDVLGIELGFLPFELADKALNVLIILLALALAGSFYFKNKN